jgi:hypothetical protein
VVLNLFRKFGYSIMRRIRLAKRTFSTEPLIIAKPGIIVKRGVLTGARAHFITSGKTDPEIVSHRYFIPILENKSFWYTVFLGRVYMNRCCVLEFERPIMELWKRLHNCAP